MKPTIITASGLTFDIQNPTADMICIEDIAHALSHCARFAGHTKVFYSVAEHSVEVSYLVPMEHQLAALLHDATEAYLGDMTSPLKMLCPDYRAIESNLHAVIFRAFNLNPEMDESIKRADLQMLATERQHLLPASDEPWSILDGVAPGIGHHLGAFSPSQVSARFLTRYYRLTQEPVVMWPVAAQA